MGGERASTLWRARLVPGSGSPPIKLPERLGGGGLGSGPSEPSLPSSSLCVLSVFAAAQMESWIIDQGTLSFDRLVSCTSSFEMYLFACRWCCGCYTSLTAQPKKLRNLSPCALVMGSTSRPTKT